MYQKINYTYPVDGAGGTEDQANNIETHADSIQVQDGSTEVAQLALKIGSWHTV